MSANDLISFDVDIFRSALDSASLETEKIVKQAIYSTMSKVRKHAASKFSSLVRETWNIRKTDLDARFNVKAGNRGDHYDSFEMTIKGKSVSLAHFGAIQYAGSRKITERKGMTMRRRSKFQGVQVEVLKGRRVQLKGAWLQAIPNWGVVVRQRRNKDRLSAEIKAIISPASMFNDASIADRFEEDVIAFLERTFEHELTYRLTQAGYL